VLIAEASGLAEPVPIPEDLLKQFREAVSAK